MKTHGAKQQREALKSAPKGQLQPVFEVRDYCFFMCIMWELVTILISVNILWTFVRPWIRLEVLNGE